MTIDDAAAMADEIAGHDIVLSATPYHLTATVADAAKTAGAHYLDLTEDVHEYVELHNPDTQPVSLAGWKVTGAIRYSLPAGATIQPGEYRVLAQVSQRGSENRDF